MVLALVLALCIGYGLYGTIEAVLWSRKGADAFPWNEHIIFSIQRFVFGVTIVMAGYAGYTVAAVSMVVSLFFFFFMHDGAIYLFRNLIDEDIYPRRWFDTSTTSTARMKTMSCVVRIILASIGLALAIYFQFNLC